MARMGLTALIYYISLRIQGVGGVLFWATITYLPTIWYSIEEPGAWPRCKHEYERARPEAPGDISYN